MVHPLPAEAIDQLAPHLLLEVLPVRFVGAQIVVERDVAAARVVPRRAIDRALLEHRLQDDVASGHGAREADRRRITRRRFHQPREERRLIDREL